MSPRAFGANQEDEVQVKLHHQSRGSIAADQAQQKVSSSKLRLSNVSKSIEESEDKHQKKLEKEGQLSLRPIKGEVSMKNVAMKSSKMKKQQKIRQEDQETTNAAELKQAHQLAASLRQAANEGKVELVRLLLRCGANLNAQDAEFGNSPLHLAAWNGFSDTIQVLCKHRASAALKNKPQPPSPVGPGKSRPTGCVKQRIFALDEGTQVN